MNEMGWIFDVIIVHLQWSFTIPFMKDNTYVMGQRPLEILLFFQRGDRPYTSKSDVSRRQILTYKDCPRNERIKIFLMAVDP